MKTANLISGILLVALFCTPVVYLTMSMDAGDPQTINVFGAIFSGLPFDIGSFFRLLTYLLVGGVILGAWTGITKGYVPALIGNIISLGLSLYLILPFRTLGWDAYYSPVGTIGMAIILTMIFIMVQIIFSTLFRSITGSIKSRKKAKNRK